MEFELRSVNQKILTDLDPRSVRSWDMSTDLRISSTLRRTAREGRLTDTDPDPYPYRWNSKGGPKYARSTDGMSKQSNRSII